MANSILTLGDITREVLMVLTGSLAFAKNVNRQYDDRFGKTGAKIGATANVRIPPKFTVGTTAAVTAQDFAESTVPVRLDSQRNIAIEVNSADLTLSLDDFSKRFVAPAAKQLAATVDADGVAKMYKTLYNQVGTPGTAFTSIDLFLDAFSKLQQTLAGVDDLKMVVNAKTWTGASKLLTSLFAPKSGDEIVKSYVASALGFDWYLDSNVIVHTVGTHGGSTKTINGAGQSGATLSIAGLPVSQAGALKAGDVFTINGVYAVHPISKVALTDLQQFVVTADVTSNGSGVGAVGISPAIVLTGAGQNVSAGPASGATVNIAGASATQYQMGLAFHPDAFVLATAPLSSMAANSDNVYTEMDPETNISVTVEKWRDGRAGTDVFRVDVLYGWSGLRPELGCRVVNA